MEEAPHLILDECICLSGVRAPVGFPCFLWSHQQTAAPGLGLAAVPDSSPRDTHPPLSCRKARLSQITHPSPSHSARLPQLPRHLEHGAPALSTG